MSDQVKKPGNATNKRGSGYKKPYASAEKAKGGFGKKEYGKKWSNGGENYTDSKEKKPFGGEKRTFNGDRKPFGGEMKPYTQRKPAFGGERRPQGAKPYGRPAPRREAPKPVTDGMPARRLALAVIREVTENGAYASLALDAKLTKSGLTQQDRHLVSRLVYDTLENLIKLDYALNQIMARPDTDIKLRNILRLGACQILLEDRIPESAATNTCVNLCKEVGMEGLGGVCNGILRNLIRQKDTLQWPDPVAEPIKAKSIQYSMPEWLVEKLMADWGEEMGEAIMAARQQEALTLRPNLMKLDDAGFETLLNKKVWQHEKAALPHAWHIRGMADIAQDSDFLGGNFSIQSESSMMACLALAPKRGANLLDACAAPGGKSCYLAEMLGGTGRVQAWELHEHRTALVAAQVKRLGLENVRPMTRDASKLREDLVRSFDGVLLDAPCSGLGNVADKPDMKLRITPESVAELMALQKQLLETVSAYVKPGGVLVYSTCSVLKGENEQQVEAFLAGHPEYTLEPLPDTIPEQFRRHEAMGLQLLPCRDGVGGFYIARLRRSLL